MDKAKISTHIEEIVMPVELEEIIEESKFNLIVQSNPPNKVVSRKIKLQSLDIEWWVTVSQRYSSDTYYFFHITFHLAFQPDQLKDLESYWFSVRTASGTSTWYQFKNISNPWTSALYTNSTHQNLWPAKLDFVFTVKQIGTKRFRKHFFIPIIESYLTIANFWKRQSDPTKADFTFVVKGKEFKVHKAILEAASPVFEGLFKSNLEESLNNSCKVDQFQPEAFRSMIQFIYESKLPENLAEIAQELYEIAHYYSLEQLKEICAEEMLLQLSLENAVDLYSWSFFYELEELKKDAWKIIKSDILKIFVPMKDEPLAPQNFNKLMAVHHDYQEVLESFTKIDSP